MALLLLFTLISVRLDMLLSYQGNELYTALQHLDAAAFWRTIGIFAVLATIYVLPIADHLLRRPAQIINWRVWLNDRMLDDWLGGAAYHRSRSSREPIDNPDQRIQEDVTSFAASPRAWPGRGVVDGLAGVVHDHPVELSGPLSLFGVEFPRGMIFLAYST